MSHARNSRRSLKRPNPLRPQRTSCRHRQPSARSRFRLRLGIGGRLALGLAAVSAVIVWGHIQASRTTRIAVESVRSMQTEHEPRAQRASAVVESLVAYDRAVIEYLQSGRTAADLTSITNASNALDAAVLTYFQRPSAGSVRRQRRPADMRRRAVASAADEPRRTWPRPGETRSTTG